MHNRNDDTAYQKLIKAPYQLIAIMVIVVLIVTNISIYGLYKIGFEQQKKRLSEAVQSEAVMINMLIDSEMKMEGVNSIQNITQDMKKTVLDKLVDAHKKFLGFGDSGEYTLGELNNAQIHFLLSHRHSDINQVGFIALDSTLAQPMQMALKGYTGTIVGLDYRGVEVLAAYEPIEGFGWGIVAKIDTKEIQEPYIEAAIFGFFISIILMIIGSIIVLYFTHPLLLEIEKNRKYNRMLFNESQIGLILTDMKGKLIDVNPMFLELVGYTLDEIQGMSCSQLTPSKYKEEDQELLRSLIQNRCYHGYEKEYIHKNGQLVNVRLSGSLIEQDGQEFIWSSIENITERKRYEIALMEASLVFEHTHEGIMITDANRNLIRVNGTFTKITGFTAKEVLGKNPRFLQSGLYDQNFYNELWTKIDSEGVWYGEIKNKRKNGEYFIALQSITAVVDEKGNINGYVSVFSDISERKNYELQLAHTATHDSLTTLSNRLFYNTNLEKAIQTAKRNQNKIGVLFIDLNHFKEVNDTLGHEIGDHLLKEVALRLTKSVREEDTVSRFGGDEFAIILRELKVPQDALKIVQKIIEIVEKPFYINEHFLQPSLSIGVSIYPDDGEELTVLLKHADEAMYRVKQKRELKYQFYSQPF